MPATVRPHRTPRARHLKPGLSPGVTSVPTHERPITRDICPVPRHSSGIAVGVCNPLRKAALSKATNVLGQCDGPHRRGAQRTQRPCVQCSHFDSIDVREAPGETVHTFFTQAEHAKRISSMSLAFRHFSPWATNTKLNDDQNGQRHPNQSFAFANRHHQPPYLSREHNHLTDNRQ